MLVEGKCSRQRLAEYRELNAYVGRLLDIPGVRGTVNIDHVKQCYCSIRSFNPNGIVPVGPDLGAWGL